MAITKIIADSITSGAIANTPAFLVKLSTATFQWNLDKSLVLLQNFLILDNALHLTNLRVASGKAGKYFWLYNKNN